MSKIITISFTLVCLLIVFFQALLYRSTFSLQNAQIEALQRIRQELLEGQHTLTLPANCYSQLTNANMIQIKIVK